MPVVRVDPAPSRMDDGSRAVPCPQRAPDPDPVVRIGFTGTQMGMTGEQEETFLRLVHRLVRGTPVEEKSISFHHGCCIGADSDAHNLMLEHFPDVLLVGHPASDVGVFKQALPRLTGFRKVFAPRKAMDRNTIIAKVGPLIVTPGSTQEMRRSGTWSTVRRSRTYAQYPRYLIFPDGTLKKER